MADLLRASLTRADLRGASLHEARISGVFFPANLAPEEIRLSVLLGTRGNEFDVVILSQTLLAALYERASEMGLEGIVSKRASSWPR